MSTPATAIDDAFALGVEIVPSSQELCHAAFDWAGKLGHSRVYDGLYLALAERLGAEFWTADKRLARAAEQLGLSWVRLVA